MAVDEAAYDSKIVGKIVHIIRHPLDNIVARFHLDNRRNHYFSKQFPNNHTGFAMYCNKEKARDKRLRCKPDPDGTKAGNTVDQMGGNSITEEEWEAIPCANDFIRYVKWHNNAFNLTRMLSVPSLVFHYEDYGREDMNGTAQSRLLQFLELERVHEGIEFEKGKKYGDFYTAEQTKAIWGLLRHLASNDTWHQLEPYLDGSSL